MPTIYSKSKPLVRTTGSVLLEASSDPDGGTTISLYRIRGQRDEEPPDIVRVLWTRDLEVLKNLAGFLQDTCKDLSVMPAVCNAQNLATNENPNPPPRKLEL